MGNDTTIVKMREKYPDFLGSVALQSFDESPVPKQLREYVAYAALWGIADDVERELLVERSPEAAREDLLEIIDRIDDELDEWLAGPEADAPPSAAYIAFSAMRMAADFM